MKNEQNIFYFFMEHSITVYSKLSNSSINKPCCKTDLKKICMLLKISISGSKARAISSDVLAGAAEMGCGSVTAL